MPAFPQNSYARNCHGYPTPPSAEFSMKTYSKDPIGSGLPPYQLSFQVPIRARVDDRSQGYHQDHYMRQNQHQPIQRVTPPNQMYHNMPYMPPPPPIGTVSHYPPNNYYERQRAPMVLRPIQSISRQLAVGTKPQARQEPKTEESPTVGGVSAKLEYNMDAMTDFVTQSARTVVIPYRKAPSFFRKWVHGVLRATRLPSATIFLAFDYLAFNVQFARAKGTYDVSDQTLMLMVTVALVLGSKFLDDNTFVNSAWNKVSDIDLATLNRTELEWLQAMDFRLHRDPKVHGGFNQIKESWKQFNEARNAQNMQCVYSPQSAPLNNSYSRFGPVGSTDYGSSQARSPPSASSTESTTMTAHYASQNSWPSLNESYSNNSNFSYHPPSSSQGYFQGSRFNQSSSPYSSMADFGYKSTDAHISQPVFAPNHGVDCICNACSRAHVWQPHFGAPQLISG